MSDPILYLRARNPVPVSERDDPRFMAPAGRLKEILATAPVPATGHRWRRPAWTAGFAALAIAVVASVVLFTRGGTSTASAAFDRLAKATEAQSAMVSSGRPIRTATTVLTSTTVGEHGGYVVLQSERSALTIRPDGVTTRTTTTGVPEFPGPRDRQRWIRSGRPAFAPPGTSVETIRQEPLSAPPPEELSTPDRARRYLIDTARSQDLPEAVGPFVVAQDLLGVGPVNPRIQANIYRALGSIGGVSTADDPDTADAHRSVTFSVISGHTGARVRYAMRFDAQTGQLVESTQTLLDAQPWIDATPPTLLNRYMATPLVAD